VHAAQKQADQRHGPDNQTEDDDNAQRVTLRLVPVIAGNDGIEQVIDIAPMNLPYIKLHARV
jgi:hypothetical protein